MSEVTVELEEDGEDEECPLDVVEVVEVGRGGC